MSSCQDSKDLRTLKMRHVKMGMRVRKKYKKQGKAVLFLENFCSIIDDGANQSAFGLPHFVAKSKEQS